MTTLFDGMASMMNEAFGALVTVLPTVGGGYELKATFRDTPVEVLDENNQAILLLAANLSVPATLVGSLSQGDQVRLSTGRLFRIANGQPNGSPALDGFVVFELEEIFP